MSDAFKWIKVGDQPRPVRLDVLIRFNSGGSSMWIVGSDDWQPDDCEEVTHWARIPEPPQEKTELELLKERVKDLEAKALSPDRLAYWWNQFASPKCHGMPHTHTNQSPPQ